MKKVVAFMLALLVIAGAFSFESKVSVQAAAKVKLNKKSLTLQVGKTRKIKVKNATDEVSWTTSDEKVAIVNSKGKITAKGEGACQITATVGKKKLVCNVTVTAKKTTATETVKVGEIVFPYDSSWITYLPPTDQTSQGVSATMAGYVTEMKSANDITVLMYESIPVPADEFKYATSSKDNFETIANMLAGEITDTYGVKSSSLEISKESGVYYGKTSGTGDFDGITMSYVMCFKLANDNFIITMVMSNSTVSSENAEMVLEACKAAKK